MPELTQEQIEAKLARARRVFAGDLDTAHLAFQLALRNPPERAKRETLVAQGRALRASFDSYVANLAFAMNWALQQPDAGSVRPVQQADEAF